MPLSHWIWCILDPFSRHQSFSIVSRLLHLRFSRHYFWYYFLSYLVKYWKQSHKSIHFLKGNDTRNTPIATDCCNYQESLRKSQKQILIYCLEKCEQSRVQFWNANDSPPSCFLISGLFHLAVHFYQKALDTPPSIANDSRFNLQREIAYNLSLIYRHSGNEEMAAQLLYKYVVVWRAFVLGLHD